MQLSKIKFESVLVSGGCTKLMQAPNVACNKPFKAFVRNQYYEWLANGICEYIAAGNRKLAPRQEVFEWIHGNLNSLQNLTNFLTAKIAVNKSIFDGNYDSKIY